MGEEKVLFDFVLNVRMRSSTMYPGHYVSRCGQYVRNTRYENITKVYGKNPIYTYLQSDGIRIHRLVAAAWVHNPFPGHFGTVDHIDGKTQNNDCGNLRWVSKRLNCIHRNRKRYYEKVRTRTGQVYFVSKIRSNGVVTKEFSETQGEAEKKTRALINGMFRKIYFENLLNAPPGLPRSAHSVLWTDSRKDTPRRHTTVNSDNKRSYQVRTPGYSL